MLRYRPPRKNPPATILEARFPRRAPKIADFAKSAARLDHGHLPRKSFRSITAAGTDEPDFSA